MPDLTCHDADLNGYGCISSQFVDSLVSTYQTDENVVLGNPQWFGKITRFRYELQLPNTTRVPHDTIFNAIANRQITNCTLHSVEYHPDSVDPNIVYAEGQLEITAGEGSPLPSGTYRFRHTLLRVWRITETRLLDG